MCEACALQVLLETAVLTAGLVFQLAMALDVSSTPLPFT